MNAGHIVVVAVGGWAVLAAVTAAGWAALRGHQNRQRGRALLARQGMTDYRYATGEHAGRWASEVLVDDLDAADERCGG